MLARTCTNTGLWKTASATLVGAHSYTLTLIDHDDNYPGDPTYTLYDDVTIGAAPPPPPTGVPNGGFERRLTGRATSRRRPTRPVPLSRAAAARRRSPGA